MKMNKNKKMKLVHKFLHENEDNSQLEKMRMARQWIEKKQGKEGRRGGKQGKSRGGRKPKSIFDLYDQDRKGYVVMEDWTRIIKEIDVDWDNKTSIEEFLSWMTYEERPICRPFEKVIDEMLAQKKSEE